MNGHRRAAVALHGLHADDQAWILGRLESRERDAVAGLIRELAELGFEPEVLRAGAAARPSELTAAQRVAAARADTVYAVLANEPVLLVAQVLGVSSWPWASRLLELFTAPRRAALQLAMNQVQPSVTRDEHLVRHLAAALSEAERACAGAPKPPFMQRILAWIR